MYELACIAAVGEDHLQPPETRAQLFDQQFAAITVLNIGRMNRQRHDEPKGIHDQMALAALDFLARVVPTRPA